MLYIPLSQDSWYSDLSYFLHHGKCIEHLNPKERRDIRIKFAQYLLISSMLFYMNYHGLLLRCLEKEEAKKVLKFLHNGPISGHFARETMAHKILRVGYYYEVFIVNLAGRK